MMDCSLTIAISNYQLQASPYPMQCTSAITPLGKKSPSTVPNDNDVFDTKVQLILTCFLLPKSANSRTS